MNASRAAARASRRKRRDEGGIVGQMLGEQLQGNGALEPLVEGQMHG